MFTPKSHHHQICNTNVTSVYFIILQPTLIARRYSTYQLEIGTFKYLAFVLFPNTSYNEAVRKEVTV